jgi:hypothetical protein
LGVIIKFSELGRINQIGFGWIWIFRFFHVTEESGRKWSPTRAVDIWGRRGRGATGHMSGDQDFFFPALFFYKSCSSLIRSSIYSGSVQDCACERLRACVKT